MKQIVCTIAFFISFFSFSQELVQDISLKLNKKTDVFQIVEEQKNQVSLFFNDTKKVKVVRFNDSFKVIDSLVSNRPSKDYDDIVGYSLSENKYWSYWSNSNGKEIESQCFNFDTKQIYTKSFSLIFEKERVIKKVTVNNVFYLITIVKNTNTLNIYVFNNDVMTKKSIDLSGVKLFGYNNEVNSLWEIVSSSTTIEPPLSFQNISNETPASLAFSANKRKLYTFDNNLVFTFDVCKNFTQTISINLNDFTFVSKSYNQPFILDDEYSVSDSNSYLLKDKIVQIRLNSNDMLIGVKNIDGEEFKTFEAHSGKDLDFKNSDIFQENGSVKNVRILDKSNQLIRKIYNMNPSLSIYTLNDKNYVVIGGISALQNNNGAMIGAMIGGFSGALIGAAISTNYSVNNLNSYIDRKVVYINCLFDMDFNHLDGNLNKLAFDKLRVFNFDHKDLIIPTVFKLKDKLYYGAYNKETLKYCFYKFDN